LRGAAPRTRKGRAAPEKQHVAAAVARIRHPHLWRVALLWAVLFAAYSNSFEAGLVFDNDLAILQDVRVHAATSANLGRILSEGYWARQPEAGGYRPLTTLSYLVNYAVLGNGPNPAGYHWINLVLHCVNASLVYALGVLIFEAPLWALALAALWGLHPLLTEAVTNVVGRADLLAAFGVLAGLLCHVKGSVSTGRRKLAWLTALVASQTVGLFSKENAAVLPGIMLLYDLTWSQRATWRKRAPSYAVLTLPFVIFFYLYWRALLHTHIEVLFSNNPLISAGFCTARLTAVKVIGRILWLFIWPARLSADYSYNAVTLFGWHPLDVFGLAVCVGALCIAVRWRSRKPLLFFLGFFFVALSPTSNLVILIGSVMAERWTYLPSIGLAGCALAALQTYRRRKAVGVAVALLCLVFAARTYARNFDWYDAYSLWSSAVQAVPDDARAHMNLGNALLQIPDRIPEAIAEYEAALRIYANYAQAHNNLGDALLQTGRRQDAMAEYQAAVRSDPNNAQAHSNLGSLLAQIPDRAPEAVAQLRTALRLQPDFGDAHYNLANILARMPSQLPEAVAEYQAALRSKPEDPRVHNNLGDLFAQMPGHLPEAAAELEAALQSAPGDARAHNNLGNVYAQMPGRMPAAIAQWQAALRIDPSLMQTHYNLAMALSGIPGRKPEAIAEMETVLRMTSDPRVQQILNRLRAVQP
jgi:protein O-mannosyl-transferase